MDRQRRAWLRLLVVVAAAALAETLAIYARVPYSRDLVPLLIGAAVFYLTAGLGLARPRGEVRYWRGRRIDDD